MDLIRLEDVPLGRLLVTAGHIVGQRWNRHLAEEHGLTHAGMVTLMALARHGELPHRAVAEACFIRPATLTGIVDTLERDGLVERQRDGADRRSVRLVLTPAGRERVAALTTLMQSGRPMTSVDADPAKAAVIRQFLLEIIGSEEEKQMTTPDTRPETSAC
ncbi:MULTISPECIES: MarR family winged helix-turn-helix transcriptional regulator [unclassified Micromonospora]|uniref:MarR family winged helix-turn-helix transcriptional regulator n=1 Tax=unclassified Micromonospora TaxID=2617518 RepID=UPI00362591BD